MYAVHHCVTQKCTTITPPRHCHSPMTKEPMVESRMLALPLPQIAGQHIRWGCYRDDRDISKCNNVLHGAVHHRCVRERAVAPPGAYRDAGAGTSLAIVASCSAIVHTL
jgi:hypothetical protein